MRYNHRLESRVRENRMHGSEGGEGANPSRPLSGVGHQASGAREGEIVGAGLPALA